MPHFLFEPIYQQRVWGGRGLESKLGRTLPAGQTIGESWEMVDRPEAMSMTADARSLRSLIETDSAHVMGPEWDPARRFPILVKWLDCQDRLSLQVHPPAAVAAELGGEPKTENWYIADAKPGACLMAGLKRGVNREDFEKGLHTGAVEALVHHLPVAAGESILIPSGRLHAIGGGNLILEIQQNSDTTYRVHDWGRVGLDGEARTLHLEQSLRCTDLDDVEPATLKPKGPRALLAETEAFRLSRHCLRDGETIEFAAGQPRILSLVSGRLVAEDGSVLPSSRNALLPAAETLRYRADGTSVVLVTEDFHKFP